MNVYSMNKAGKGVQHRPVINLNGTISITPMTQLSSILGTSQPPLLSLHSSHLFVEDFFKDFYHIEKKRQIRREIIFSGSLASDFRGRHDTS